MSAFAVRTIFALAQILKNTLTDGRVGINDGADDGKLFALGVVCYLGHQRHLFLPFFAHFVIGSFLLFVVILIGWRLSIYYNEKKKATAKCAFLLITGSYSRGRTLCYFLSLSKDRVVSVDGVMNRAKDPLCHKKQKNQGIFPKGRLAESTTKRPPGADSRLQGGYTDMDRSP
jgi:hypothetical protein